MQQIDFDHLLENMTKKDVSQPFLRDDIKTEEVLQIYHELIDVLKKHNVTYGCATRIITSLSYSFLVGAAELHDTET